MYLSIRLSTCFIASIFVFGERKKCALLTQINKPSGQLKSHGGADLSTRFLDQGALNESTKERFRNASRAGF
jgi:hypothetical protein